MTTDIGLRGVATSAVLGFPAWLGLALLLMPDTRSARIWSVSPAPILLYAAIVVPYLYRLKGQQRLTPRLFTIFILPTVVYSAIVWGAMPLAVGTTNLGLFYLTVTVVVVVAIAGVTWMTGQWALAMLYGGIQASMVLATTYYYDRPEADAMAAMMGLFVMALFAITVAGMFILERSLLQTVMARDRQGMIDLLLHDFERSGQDWVWEVGDDLVFARIPDRMGLAARGDSRVRAGVNLTELLADDEDALGRLASDAPFETVIRTAGEDGKGELQLTGRPILVHGRRVGYRGVGSDLGAAERAAEADRTAERMDAMVALTSGINHDFNNQLATVLSSVDLARILAADSPDVVGYLDRAAQACLRSRSLTTDLSAALGLHAPSEPEPFLIGREIRSVITDVGSLHPDTRFEVDIDDGLVGFANPTHFRRVVRNLIENACQANYRNPSTCGIVAVTAEGGDSKPSPMVRVRIADDGPGVSEEDADRIFEPFYTTRQKDGGSGLGLAVAHGLIRHAGGSLTLEVAQPSAVFSMQLPQAESSASTEPSLVDSTAEMLTAASLKGTFLIVEDDEHLAASLVDWVEAHGATADWVNSARNGVERVATRGGEYQCILTDVVLPDGDGTMVVAELRTHIPDAPAVYLSGFPSTLLNDLDEHLRCPFVAKPFASSELLQALSTAGVNVGPSSSTCSGPLCQ